MATNDDVDMHKDVEAAAHSDLRPKRSFLHRTILHRGDHHPPTPPSPVPSEKKQTNDDDDDDDFDWNDDPDQPKPRRRKTTRERIHEAMRRPCCWNYLSPFAKRLIFAIVGSCLFISAAICVYALLPEPTDEERAQPGFKNIRSNLQCWLYWAAFQWHIFWLTTVIVEAVPSAVSLWTKLFKGRRSERVKSAMEVSKWLLCCTMIVWCHNSLSYIRFTSTNSLVLP